MQLAYNSSTALIPEEVDVLEFILLVDLQFGFVIEEDEVSIAVA